MEGDRVRLSRELERDMLAAGVIRPFARNYARRLPKAPALLAEIEVRYRDSLFDDEPLPMLAMPQRERSASRKREKIPPPSLPLDYAPTVADLLASLGLTHQAAGEVAGVSRARLPNIINYQFNPSRAVRQRVLELARAA